MPVRRLACPVALVTVVLTGCGDATPLAERDGNRDESVAIVRMDDSREPSSPSSTQQQDELEPDPSRPDDGVRRGVADDLAVLLDEPWTVVEGVWYLGPDDGGLSSPADDDLGLLSVSADRRSVFFSGPALYGRHDLRVERHPAPPPLPDWCEDASEVSLRHDDEQLSMGSFESVSGAWDAPRGPLRVRYCVEGLDRVAAETAEDEFDGDDYRLYSGRHLVQLWAAPVADPTVLRQGSAFARSLPG